MEKSEIFDQLRKIRGSLTSDQVKAGDEIIEKLGQQILERLVGMSNNNYTLTVAKLKSIYPNADTNFVDSINKIAPKYGVNTKERMAMFLAQVIHESNGFTKLRESLNYRPDRLLAVFPKYVKSLDQAKRLVAAGQVAIADCVYGGRMGNGVNNGDGYKYRGGGLLHLTGKDNYAMATKEIKANGTNIDIVVNPELITTPNIAVETALIFWKKNNLNAISDAKNVTLATKVVNGGTNGLDERTKLYNKAMQVL